MLWLLKPRAMLIIHKRDAGHLSCPPSLIHSEPFVSHTLALKGVGHTLERNSLLRGKSSGREETYDYIYINGSVSLERCFVC